MNDERSQGDPARRRATSSRSAATARSCCRRSACRATIYPAKGYSATIAIGDHRGAPTVSLTDLAWKIVFTRLGDRLRVAGTAELSGWDTDAQPRRAAKRSSSARSICFPDAGERESVPLLDRACGRPRRRTCRWSARTRYRNLCLDTGHGTLGWTMACGSGSALADVDRRPPA